MLASVDVKHPQTIPARYLVPFEVVLGMFAFYHADVTKVDGPTPLRDWLVTFVSEYHSHAIGLPSVLEVINDIITNIQVGRNVVQSALRQLLINTWRNQVFRREFVIILKLSGPFVGAKNSWRNVSITLYFALTKRKLTLFLRRIELAQASMNVQLMMRVQNFSLI